MSRKSEIKNRRAVNEQMQEARKRRVYLDCLWREYATLTDFDEEVRDEAQSARIVELEALLKSEGVWNESYLRLYL